MWLTLEEVRDAWIDAPLDDSDLTRLLEAAQAECEAFMPAQAEDFVPESRHEQALLLQARALWRSIKAGTGDAIGPDGFQVVVFPLDWTVKQLLRPKPGRPVIA